MYAEYGKNGCMRGRFRQSASIRIFGESGVWAEPLWSHAVLSDGITRQTYRQQVRRARLKSSSSYSLAICQKQPSMTAVIP